jgi:hypothetical protein
LTRSQRQGYGASSLNKSAGDPSMSVVPKLRNLLLACLLPACTVVNTRTVLAPRLPPGPEPRMKLTEAYVRTVARDAAFWTWPMVNVWNRRLAFAQTPEPGLMGGIVPVAPVNRLSMLRDYIDPAERLVACPNQDVVYGACVLALDQGPVVVQVPDFGGRFWVYQVVDLRTDSFAELGAMYGTEPGCYLLVGPDWQGELPAGIVRGFRSPSHTGFLVPRVFQQDDGDDKRAVRAVIDGIDVYPLTEFTGAARPHDWSKSPKLPAQAEGAAETRWVFPEKLVDQLPDILADAPPMPGEESRYAALQAVLAAAKKDEALRKAFTDEATKALAEVVDPLLQFRAWGVPAAHHWTTIHNGAVFGTDYFTRTAVAKSNIFVNKAAETKYFYLDLDATGRRLNGKQSYTVTFAAGDTPPVDGFWSLTLYNQHHFFAPNAINRYSVGTKNKDLKPNADGSLTIYVQADEPKGDKRANWLPAPKGEDFSLYLRAYAPRPPVLVGDWTPPGAVLQE